jgi:phytoene/squalene synthetase
MYQTHQRSKRPVARVRRGAYARVVDDWAYCEGALREVSRTFSQPIELLEDLRPAVTCSYLLCRIADTVEDDPDLDPETRDALFDALLAVLEDGSDTREFTARYRAVRREGPDADLARNIDRVMRVFAGLPAAQRGSGARWIAEMVRGMGIYARRPLGEGGLVALENLADLERYCYFVAGTVGHLLTELFEGALAPLDRDRTRVLDANAEDFGLGLQLVNVLKDITDDRGRRVSYVPRSLFVEHGLGVNELLDPSHRATAHRLLDPIFRRAERALDAAFDYTLAIPPHARGIRLFCLLPIFMAVETLVLARGNDRQLVPGAAVKIERDAVYRIIAECTASYGDDDALRRRWPLAR